MLYCIICYTVLYVSETKSVVFFGQHCTLHWKLLLCLQLFDVLKRSQPGNLKKIVPLLGDCMELGLGLSPSDRQMLQGEVSIVFHCATSVRFNDTLMNAVVMNTRCAREVMLLGSRRFANNNTVSTCSLCKRKWWGVGGGGTWYMPWNFKNS
jgi:hypothetical protein